MTNRARYAVTVALVSIAIAAEIAAFFYFQPAGTHRAPVPVNTMSVALDDDDAPKPDEPLIFQAVPADEAQKMNAERPDYVGAIVPARSFSIPLSSFGDGSAERAVDCLAAAVYYEARSESLQGQRAVAQVVLNRARDPLFPGSVCGVVFQGSDRSTGCQFSFTCDGSLRLQPREPLWERSRSIARAALGGYVETSVGLATHYHTQWVVPVWRTDLVKLRTIGAHIFYTWRGRQTSASGLRTAYAGFEPPLVAGLSDEIGIPDIAQPAESALSGSFTAAPVDMGPLAPTGERRTPAPPNLNADLRAGTLVVPGSQLHGDNRIAPLSQSGSALPK